MNNTNTTDDNNDIIVDDDNKMHPHIKIYLIVFWSFMFVIFCYYVCTHSMKNENIVSYSERDNEISGNIYTEIELKKHEEKKRQRKIKKYAYIISHIINEINDTSNINNKCSETTQSFNKDEDVLNEFNKLLKFIDENNKNIEPTNMKNTEKFDKIKKLILNEIRKFKESDNFEIDINIIPTNDEHKSLCSICFDEIENSDLEVLLCFHTFHQTCVNEWKKSKFNTSCPICRTTII